MTELIREQWEEPGYRIGDHTSSPMVRVDELLYTVNHYPAASTISPSDPVAYFRQMQRSYVDGRGYSIGYSWGYWPDGLEVELRGWDYRNAANDDPSDDENENLHSVAFLIVVPGLGDGGQPGTSAQRAAVQRRIADVHARVGRTLPNIVHGDLEPTQCAGAGVNHQTHTGQYLPSAPTPLPPVESEEDLMIVIRVKSGADYAAFRQTPAGVVSWIVDGNELTALERSGVEIADMSAEGFGNTVDYGRTLGGISTDVVRITGVSVDRWVGRAIA